MQTGLLFFGSDISVLKWLCWQLHNSANTLKSTEQYTCMDDFHSV